MTNLSVQQFFAMNGYGVYIWPAYIAVAMGMLLPILISWQARRRLPQRLHQQYRRDQHGA